MKTSGELNVLLNILETIVNGEGNNQNLQKTLPQLLRLYGLSSQEGLTLSVMPLIKKTNYVTHKITDAKFTIKNMELDENPKKLFDNVRFKDKSDPRKKGDFELEVEGVVLPPPLKTITYQLLLEITGYFCRYILTITRTRNVKPLPIDVKVEAGGELDISNREIVIKKIRYQQNVESAADGASVWELGDDMDFVEPEAVEDWEEDEDKTVMSKEYDENEEIAGLESMLRELQTMQQPLLGEAGRPNDDKEISLRSGDLSFRIRCEKWKKWRPCIYNGKELPPGKIRNTLEFIAKVIFTIIELILWLGPAYPLDMQHEFKCPKAIPIPKI